MNKNFILTAGKYKGKTIEWIEENNPDYLVWVKENAKNLLKGSEISAKKEIKFSESPIKTMSPNMSFWSEGPADICKPYLDKMKNNEKDN